MEAESILLEPWYDFRLELPPEQVGRALSDLQRMGGQAGTPETAGALSVLTGSAPVAGLRDYGREVAAYTRGRGRLSCTAGGYAPCHNAGEVIAALGYDPERDVDNPADSVFCAHGAGYSVKWSEVKAHAHVDSGLCLGAEPPPPEEAASVRPRSVSYAASLEQDKELQAIFERTYGKVERGAFRPQPKPARTSLDDRKYSIQAQKQGPEYLLADGYNLIFAWEELKAVARDNPGRRPADAHGGAQQLPGLQAEHRHSGVRRLQGAPQRPGCDEVPQHLRGLHQGGRDGGHLH
mgnify:CR=1 FL=1